MTSARVNTISQRRTNGDEATRAQRQARERVYHQRLLKAARALVVQWRRGISGSYHIPAGAALALCEAIDDSWDHLKGVDE